MVAVLVGVALLVGVVIGQALGGSTVRAQTPPAGWDFSFYSDCPLTAALDRVSQARRDDKAWEIYQQTYAPTEQCQDRWVFALRKPRS